MAMQEVCAHGVQPACVVGRSIWPSLASAASTLALCGAANWGLALYYFIDTDINMEDHTSQILHYALFALGMPFLPLIGSLANVSKVWTVKQSIRKRAHSAAHPRIHPGSMSILCVCPLFLEVPFPDPIPKDMTRLLKARGYKKLEGYPKDFCPLELVAPTNAAASNGADPLASNPNDPQLDINPAAQTFKKTYLQLFAASHIRNLKSLEEREVLLTLGLAPEYIQLRFLRSRSRFQTIVTGLQAGGYVLSTLQRLAQHLAISPLEALLCFFSVIMLVQLLLELYACAHYQRPLLLRLNHHQFLQFWNASRDNSSTIYNSLRLAHRVIVAVLLVLLVTVFSALSIYYAVHYMPSCLLCSVATLLFLHSTVSFAVPFISNALMFDINNNTIVNIFTVVLYSGILTFAGSVVLAIVSTAKHWDVFHSPVSNSFTWILPHV